MINIIIAVALVIVATVTIVVIVRRNADVKAYNESVDMGGRSASDPAGSSPIVFPGPGGIQKSRPEGRLKL